MCSNHDDHSAGADFRRRDSALNNSTYWEELVRRRIVRAALVMMTVAGLAATAACSGGGGSSGATTAPTIKAGVNSIAPTARDAVKDGGQVIWPAEDIPTNYNYYELDGTSGSNGDIASALLPRFFLVDAAGTPHWNKDYLASDPVL